MNWDTTAAAHPPWPTQLDYQEVLPFPTLCFLDPELRQCEVGDRTPFGMPLPFTGQFTNVYRMIHPDGRIFAVRLFLREESTRAHHWETLRAFFQGLKKIPSCLVPVDYQGTGFWLRGQSYPLVKMAWSPGIALNLYVEKNLYDANALQRLAQNWYRMTDELETIRFVHGDLQHGNILVEEESGAIHLIDYDASFVPQLTGAVNRESGHPSYQHPGRSPVHYGPWLDRFAALVIYTAIRALAVAPELWFRLDNGDNLLFRREDFTVAGQSRAYRVLMETLRHSPAERELVQTLYRACQISPIHAPALDAFPDGNPS